MTRLVRLLKTGSSNSTVVAAPPPEAVTLESDFVIILAALLCALICVVGLIAVARCAWLRRGSGGASPRRALANKGLKKKVLNSLPKFTYVDSNNPSKWKESSECAICLADFAGGDEIRVLPQCGHGFHVGCIDTWLGSHSSCPSCRQVLVVARCQKCGQYPPPMPNAARTGSETSGSGSPPIDPAPPAPVNRTESNNRESEDAGCDSSQQFNININTNTNQTNSNNGFLS